MGRSRGSRSRNPVGFTTVVVVVLCFVPAHTEGFEEVNSLTALTLQLSNGVGEGFFGLGFGGEG